MNLTTYNYDVKWFLPTDKKIGVVLGSQGKIQTNTNRGHEILIPDANVTQYGIFSLFKYKLNKFNFLTGLRYDVKTITTSETEPEGHDEEHDEEGELHEIAPIDERYAAANGSFGITYQLDSAWLIRTNVATGFRAPNLAELTSNGVHHGALRYELGNSRLTTENNVELDLGVELTSEHVSWALSGFYNHINNFIYLAPQDSVVDNVQLFEYTQTDANLYGFETTIDIHPHAMHWLHFETQYAMVIGRKTDGTYLPRIPGNNLLNTLKAELNDFKFIQQPFMSVAVNTVFNQSNIDAFETVTSSYALLNVNIGGDLMIKKQKIELSVGVTNLLDKAYYNHLSRLKSAGINNMGRNIVVNLRVPFNIKN